LLGEISTAATSFAEAARMSLLSRNKIEHIELLGVLGVPLLCFAASGWTVGFTGFIGHFSGILLSQVPAECRIR